MTNPLLDKLMDMFYYYSTQVPEKEVEKIEKIRSQLESLIADGEKWRKLRDSDAVCFTMISVKTLHDLQDRITQLDAELAEAKVKAVRYDMLQDRYLNQNEKHFGELCGLYFDDEPYPEAWRTM